MTFQVLNQSDLRFEEGEVRNDDASEIAKTYRTVADLEGTGEPSFDFDIAEDLQELGLKFGE